VNPVTAGHTGAVPKYVKRFILPALVVALGVAIYAATQATDGRSVPEIPGVVALVPGPGDKVLVQNKVGVVVNPNYDARLSINGTDIPASQIEPPLNPGEVLFQPGPGKVIEQLLPYTNCVDAEVWRRELGPDDANMRTWCFRAS